MRSKISQREARRLRKQVADLIDAQAKRTAVWSALYPGGVHIATLDGMKAETDGRLACAQLLGAAIVGRWDDGGKRLFVYAVLP